jgi:hypothetical protein
LTCRPSLTIGRQSGTNIIYDAADVASLPLAGSMSTKNAHRMLLQSQDVNVELPPR